MGYEVNPAEITKYVMTTKFIGSPSCYTACHGSVKEFSILMKAVLDKFIELENL